MNRTFFQLPTQSKLMTDQHGAKSFNIHRNYVHQCITQYFKALK